MGWICFRNENLGSSYWEGYFLLLCVPTRFAPGDTFSINTRPTSITGGNYGIIGDNGQIVQVTDNSTIVNETNNTYYNPATGETVPIASWAYDYSDRSYKVTLEGGDSYTITYGDENIVIKEGDTTYNVYYLTDGSGSGSEACAHAWEETSRTEPTCTAPGKANFTCSKCGETKTETLKATGHTWTVKQSVTTEYDEDGNLVQQGYTIYQCSVCGEQYKDESGAGPPGGGGSGADDPSGGNIISTFFDLLGSAIGGIISGFLALLTKAVEALSGLGELFGTFTETVAGLFGGFLGFLEAVFPFLPPEFFTIISLGMLLMVAAAVLRKFLS